ncbi:hypothetical protein N9F34_00055 [Alphaproteobacteria bacterium]|nr:hypothetical protein [Alphaproteobacteria bacterium]
MAYQFLRDSIGCAVAGQSGRFLKEQLRCDMISLHDVRELKFDIALPLGISASSWPDKILIVSVKIFCLRPALPAGAFN